MRNDEPVEQASVEKDGRRYFSVNRARRSFQQLTWVLEDVGVVQGLVESLAQISGFAAVYVGDDADEKWQSETMIERYERDGRPHAHLPKVPGGRFPGETEQIDVSGNWGRALQAGYLWLWAPAQMWFGPEAFRWLDRERLLTLPVGETEELGSGVVHVRLFPWEWYSADVGSLRERQRVFWEWMGFADLEAREDEILDALSEQSCSEPSVPAAEEAPIVLDAMQAAEWVADAMRFSGYDTDFSPASLGEVDRFFAEQLREPGKPRGGGLLAEDVGSRIFAIGSYIGEVIRRNDHDHSWRWAPSEAGPDDEAGLRLVRDADDAVLWPVQRALKRYAEGEENGIAAYVAGFAALDELP